VCVCVFVCVRCRCKRLLRVAAQLASVSGVQDTLEVCVCVCVFVCVR